MKALHINKAGQSLLAQRFDVEPYDVPDQFPIGYIAVSDFGDGAPLEGVFTQVNFEANFTATGKTLDNGWFEVVKIGTPLDEV